MPTRIDVVTLFPEMIREGCRWGIPRIAMEKQLLDLGLWNPRDYADNRHRRVDDRSYGGGPGMVMQVQPVGDASRRHGRRATGRSCISAHRAGDWIRWR